MALSSSGSSYLTPPEPTSLPFARDQLEYSSRSLQFVRDGSAILRVWGPVRDPFAVEIEPSGSRWRIRGYGVGPKDARAAARQMFSLDHDLLAFYRLVRRDPVLRGTDRSYRGLRLPRDSGLFEALLNAVIGQQLSVAAANSLKRRLFNHLGAVLTVAGHEVPRVPRPDELGRLGVAGRRRLGLSGAKSTSLLHLARRESTGWFLDHDWVGEPMGEAVERLDDEPGVGRWTAENALLRGVGRTDLFVAGDLGIRRALAAYRVVRANAPEDRIRAWGDWTYPGWGSYATLYLWRKWIAERTPGP